MKRTIAIVTFVFVFTLSAVAQSGSRSPGQISKQRLASQSSEQISKEQLPMLIAKAKTPADHQKIADYYHGEAISLMAESNKHAEMGAAYARNPDKRVRNMYDHCAILTKDFKAMSETAAELAAQHEQMAKEAEQK